MKNSVRFLPRTHDDENMRAKKIDQIFEITFDAFTGKT